LAKSTKSADWQEENRANTKARRSATARRPVAGAENGQIYIVTANHVVRDGDRPGQDLLVEFHSLRGKPLPATLATHFDVGRDLAVLVVPNAKAHGIIAIS
jgi:S1-C subfamily serine protease